ncbi:hypothetical protein MPSEU_000944200 [Mayamaea pseudoterrestris]|nr:hypothetical protein MPSEU_000944200 [Mayamaea pseudoterrestris]
MIMRSVLLVAVVATTFLSTSTLAACPPGNCKPYGQCILDTRSCGDNCQERCVCNEGFAGRDCSFRVDICYNDVTENTGPRACFNGGQCFSSNNKDWSCDCSAAFGDSANYEGTQCEFPGEVISCENDKKSSDYAFCVNGGVCGKNKVDSGEMFRGCTCPKLFEGRHCQFPLGMAPKRETILYPTTQPSGLGPGAIAIVVLLSLAAAVGLIFYAVIVKRRRQVKQWDNKSNNNNLNNYTDYDEGELQLEEVDMNDDQPPASLSPSRGGAAVHDKEII